LKYSTQVTTISLPMLHTRQRRKLESGGRGGRARSLRRGFRDLLTERVRLDQLQSDLDVQRRSLLIKIDRSEPRSLAEVQRTRCVTMKKITTIWKATAARIRRRQRERNKSDNASKTLSRREGTAQREKAISGKIPTSSSIVFEMNPLLAGRNRQRDEFICSG
jgi:hypothetical protein